jgi:hypothetical protein
MRIMTIDSSYILCNDYVILGQKLMDLKQSNLALFVLLLVFLIFGGIGVDTRV